MGLVEPTQKKDMDKERGEVFRKLIVHVSRKRTNERKTSTQRRYQDNNVLYRTIIIFRATVVQTFVRST